MRYAPIFAIALAAGCAHTHQPGTVELKRDELGGNETERMTGLFLYESDETRIYMDASYDKPKHPGPPDTVHVVFTVVTPWGFEKDIDPTWVVITDAFRRDWGDLNRDESGVSLKAGGRYRELFTIDVPPMALETIGGAHSASFRFGPLEVPLATNDIMTIRKLVDTWHPLVEPANPKVPPRVAPPNNVKI